MSKHLPTRVIYLEGNQFVGPISTSFYQMTNLDTISISNNQLMVVNLADSFGNFWVDGNWLEGTIPSTEMGNMKTF